METHRQPSDVSSVSDAVITSESGVTEIPVASADVQREVHPEPEQPRTESRPEPEPGPVEAVADEQPSPESIDVIEAPEVPEPSESVSESSDGTDEDGMDAGSESGVEAEGSSQPAPPPPPPFGGDMIGLGGRLVYPKAAETARGGPIEYTVTFEVLVSKAGQVIDMTVASSSFDREVEQSTTDQLLRTSDLMVRGIVSFKPHTHDYRVSVVLAFDAEHGPSLRADSRIRPIEDNE